MQFDHLPPADSEVTNSTHKRTFSTGPDQCSVNDKVDKPSTNVDVPPPTKKTKVESDDAESTTSTLDNEDLIPLTSQGPNVFYGYGDALLNLFEYGEEEDPYWLKSMVMERYKAFRTGDPDQDDVEPLSYAGITSDSKNRQTPEAELLSTHFDGLSGWWYEVTVQHEKPDGMGLQVNVESSKFDNEGYVWGGKDLGEWWISDIQTAEGESRKAIETVHATMF